MPAVALAAASREALRMADVLETMLHAALDALDRGDRKRITETKRLDDVLDRLNSAIKAYLTSLDHETLDAEDDRRLSEILAFVTNLEHAGDIVEHGVMGGEPAKRLKRNLAFSRRGTRSRSARCSSGWRPMCARRRGVHDRRCARRARAARREGGVPRSRNARDRGAFRAASAPGGSKASRPARSTSTCCATSSGSTRTSPPRPIRFSNGAASCCRAGSSRRGEAVLPAASASPASVHNLALPRAAKSGGRSASRRSVVNGAPPH